MAPRRTQRGTAQQPLLPLEDDSFPLPTHTPCKCSPIRAIGVAQSGLPEDFGFARACSRVSSFSGEVITMPKKPTNEIVIDLGATLAQKGYPAPVDLDTGSGKTGTAATKRKSNT